MHTPLLFRVPLSSSWFLCKINISWRIWETGLDGVLKELDLQADEWLEQIPLFASLGCMICNQEMLGVDDFLSWIKRSSIRQGLWHTYCLVWMPCFESLKPPVPCPSFALRYICAHHNYTFQPLLLNHTPCQPFVLGNEQFLPFPLGLYNTVRGPGRQSPLHLSVSAGTLQKQEASHNPFPSCTLCTAASILSLDQSLRFWDIEKSTTDWNPYTQRRSVIRPQNNSKLV